MAAGSKPACTVTGWSSSESRDRLQLDITLENLPAAFVDGANCRPKLSVWIRRNVLRQEVDQASITLKQRKHLHRTIYRIPWQCVPLLLVVRQGSGSLRLVPAELAGGFQKCLLNILGNLSVDQDRKETTKCKRYALPESEHTNSEPAKMRPLRINEYAQAVSRGRLLPIRKNTKSTCRRGLGTTEGLKV